MNYTVKELWIYPIKSCRGIKLTEAKVSLKGFTWDRELMLVDQHGKFLTQRTFPQLTSIQVALEGKSMLLSSTKKNIEPLRFAPTLEGTQRAVEIWKDKSTAIDQGDEVAAWFKKALDLSDEEAPRLVRQSPDFIRPLDPAFAIQENAPVSFADGYPCLVTTTASLADLNKRINEHHGNDEHEVTMDRFRPNIVVETTEAFEEGDWKRIQIGSVQFDNVKPCARCIVTTTDQNTGERNPKKEPLRTLNTFRKLEIGKVMFGENLIPRSVGLIKVGDKLSTL